MNGWASSSITSGEGFDNASSILAFTTAKAKSQILKPLTAKQRELAYRWLVHGPMRVVAQPLYMGLLNAEFIAHRAVDALSAVKPAADLRNVTAILKTFERPRRLRSLVRSIRRFYPDLRIIVIDDSRDPEPLPGVTTHIMPYDSGLGAGRSKGLSLVETKYVLNLDDDFVFFNRTDLPRALDLMERYSNIDIMGGMVIDLPLYITRDYRRADLFESSVASLVPAGQRIGGLEVYDKVADFFVARTDRIRLVDWDPALKRVVHADFFTRAKGNLVTVYNRGLQVLHARNPFDTAYLSIRFNTGDDLAYLSQKFARPWGVSPDSDYGG